MDICSIHMHTGTPHISTVGHSTGPVGLLPMSRHLVLTTWDSSSRKSCKVAHLNSLQVMRNKESPGALGVT